MARGKQFVFSARTTEEGLKLLNGLKAKLGVGWDAFVIDGMCGHYKLDKVVLVLLKKTATVKEQEKKPKTSKGKSGKKNTNKKAPNKGTPASDTGNEGTTEPPPMEQ